MSNDPIVVAGMARTPMGAFQGRLAGVTAPELGAAAIKAAIGRSGDGALAPDEVLMGCVLSAGLGQAPARQAALGAGLKPATSATAISKVCGSGMKAVMLGHDLIVAGSAQIVVAGGMESMSLAPYLATRARAGLRMGHATLDDHMLRDGLEDAYDKGRSMGALAEATAVSLGLTRAEQDAYALASLERARAAAARGFFTREIVPVAGLAEDETLLRPDAKKIPRLKPAFKEGGTITAASSSSIADGAAALVLMRRTEALKRGIAPLARIVGHAQFARAAAEFTLAPSGAVRALVKRIGWTLDQVDLFEINEAFAMVALAAMRDLGLPHEKVNRHGGACVLGHPIGASGARILVTLVNGLTTQRLKRGIAAICIGGGEATAIAVELEG